MPQQIPIVLQLQELAADDDTPVSQLLRKALLIASKLDLDEFKGWINSELDGYKKVSDLPPYRQLTGVLKAFNPYNGWIPVTFAHHELEETIRKAPVASAVDHVEHLIEEGKGELLQLPLSPKQQAILRRLQSEWAQFDVSRFVTCSQMAGVLAAVRNRILTWSLDLERDGIVGTGLSFSPAEKSRAEMNPNINIHNFQGVLGDVTSSTVTQNLAMTFAPGDTRALAEYLLRHGVGEADVKSLEVAIRQDPKATEPGRFGSRVGAWVGQMVGKAASGTWDIGVAAAGTLLSNAISHHYGLPSS